MEADKGDCPEADEGDRQEEADERGEADTADVDVRVVEEAVGVRTRSTRDTNCCSILRRSVARAVRVVGTVGAPLRLHPCIFPLAAR